MTQKKSDQKLDRLERITPLREDPYITAMIHLQLLQCNCNLLSMTQSIFGRNNHVPLK